MRMSFTMMPVDDITSAKSTAVPASRTSFVRIEMLRSDFIGWTLIGAAAAVTQRCIVADALVPSVSSFAFRLSFYSTLLSGFSSKRTLVPL